MYGEINRKQHGTNARMIVAAAVLHNIMIDAGDYAIFEDAPDGGDDVQQKMRVLNAVDSSTDRTPVELELALCGVATAESDLVARELVSTRPTPDN
jgi:hypothetical protein